MGERPRSGFDRRYLCEALGRVYCESMHRQDATPAEMVELGKKMLAGVEHTTPPPYGEMVEDDA